MGQQFNFSFEVIKGHFSLSIKCLLLCKQKFSKTLTRSWNYRIPIRNLPPLIWKKFWFWKPQNILILVMICGSLNGADILERRLLTSVYCPLFVLFAWRPMRLYPISFCFAPSLLSAATDFSPFSTLLLPRYVLVLSQESKKKLGSRTVSNWLNNSFIFSSFCGSILVKFQQGCSLFSWCSHFTFHFSLFTLHSSRSLLWEVVSLLWVPFDIWFNQLLCTFWHLVLSISLHSRFLLWFQGRGFCLAYCYCWFWLSYCLYLF